MLREPVVLLMGQLSVRFICHVATVHGRLHGFFLAVLVARAVVMLIVLGQNLTSLVKFRALLVSRYDCWWEGVDLVRRHVRNIVRD